MNKRLLLLTVSALVVLMACQPPKSRSAEQVRQNVSEINRQLFDGLIAGNADEIASLYTRDGTLFPPSGEIIQGTEAIKQYWQSSIDAAQTTAVDTKPVDFERYGDTAYESGKYALQYRLPGEQQVQTADGIYLIIWKKQDSTWKLHVDMWN